MQSERVLRPVPLDATHDIDSFDCGIGRLNEYLSRLALADQTSAKTRTYVLVEDARVIAYYSFSPGVVEAALTRGSIERRQRRQVIPVVVLARLAVDGAWQSCGVGRDLLRSVAQQGAGGDRRPGRGRYSDGRRGAIILPAKRFRVVPGRCVSPVCASCGDARGCERWRQRVTASCIIA
jgi:GNAT superfamily N-acetyltransferase